MFLCIYCLRTRAKGFFQPPFFLHDAEFLAGPFVLALLVADWNFCLIVWGYMGLF